MKKPLQNTLFILSVLLMLFGINNLEAQDPQDLYSFSIRKNGDKFDVSLPKFLNRYNTNSYNNQPYFKDPKSIMVTSMMKGKSQTDIYALNLFERKKAQVTRTPESEYSPQKRPGTNSFNCVRVESDGETQRLWEFPNSHTTQGKPLFPDVKNVGYYHWLDKNRVALFLVGEPHSLAIGDTRDNSIQTITSKIGRGMGSTSNGELLFVQKLSDKTWYIKKLNPSTQKSTIVIETLDGAEDFVVMEDGSLMMAQGSKIYTVNPKLEKTWKPVADFSKYGLNKITRIAFNGGRLLVVVNEPN